MATIQVRDIPDDAYEMIRELARDAGQSLQAYMREHVIEMAGARRRKAEAIRRLEKFLAEDGGIGCSAEQIVAEVHAERR